MSRPVTRKMHKLISIVNTACAVLWLVACGGGGGGSSVNEVPIDTTPPVNGADQALADNTAYSSARNGSLPGATEAAAVTHHNITLGGQTIAYTARAGHLIAREPVTARAQAAFFYVAYTADGAAPANRPVTFFYNGGPGSSTVWLHLGSYGPRRLATSAPSTTASRPLPMVANAESLLDVTDLVFVNAVGTGLSTAIAPFTNGSFYSVDADAALMRDFVLRWLVANDRLASPKFLFGESYGGPRTAILAPLLHAAGVRLDGLILQSPALNYASNCDVSDTPNISCAGYIPSYGAVGVHFVLTTPLPTSLSGFIDELRGFTDSSYAPAVNAVLAGAAAPSNLLPRLAGYTGLPAGAWQAQFNKGPGGFRNGLLPGSLLGRYDARMAAPLGSALAAEGDPSSTFITTSFVSAIDTELRNTLRYTAQATYVVLSDAINTWSFNHAGRPVPDTIPDLATALQQNPQLRVLAISGLHDLATPFHQTELDLARLGTGLSAGLGLVSRVTVRNYAGGHMSYLDDSSRAQQKADLAAFYRATPLQRSATALAFKPHATALADSAGTPSAMAPISEAAIQAPLRDPWVPRPNTFQAPP